MKRFLKDQKVNEEYFGAGLIIRTFLQMIELSPSTLSDQKNSTNSENEIELIDNCQIKIEDSDSYDEMIGYSDEEGIFKYLFSYFLCLFYFLCFFTFSFFSFSVLFSFFSVSFLLFSFVKTK